MRWLSSAASWAGTALVFGFAVTVGIATFVAILGTPILLFTWLCQQVFG